MYKYASVEQPYTPKATAAIVSDKTAALPEHTVYTRFESETPTSLL